MLRSHGLFRRVAVVFLMLFSLSATLPVAASGQGNSESARSCQGEGFLDYTDADGNPFKNAGQCTRFAAQGNTLVPVMVTDPDEGTDPDGGTDPVGSAYLSLVATQSREDGGTFTYRGAGLLPGTPITVRSYWVVERLPGPGDVQVEFVVGAADANGDFYQVTGFVCDSFISRSIFGLAADGTTLLFATAEHPC
jgi:hypothetical protein